MNTGTIVQIDPNAKKAKKYAACFMVVTGFDEEKDSIEGYIPIPNWLGAGTRKVYIHVNDVIEVGKVFWATEELNEQLNLKEK